MNLMVILMELSNRTGLGIKFAIAFLSPMILYWQDLTIILNEALHNEILTHILIIPLLLTYILYRIRTTLFAVASNQYITPTSNKLHIIKNITGILICLLAYLLKWFGSYTFLSLEYHIISLPIFVAGIIIIIFNFQTLRTLLFPIAFLIFLIPLPIEQAQKAGSALATLSSQVAYNVLKTMGLNVSLLNIYGSPVIYLNTPSGVEIPFAIDIACSGLYSLIGFVIFAVFAAYIVREPLQKKLTILALGLPLIYGLNILRIILIVLLGRYSGPTLALNIFHLFGGWTLILISTLLLLTIVEKVLNIQIFGSSPETCTHSIKNEDESYCFDCGMMLITTQDNFSMTDVVKFTLILAITISLILVQVPTFALAEGPTEVFKQKATEVQTITKILPDVEGYKVDFIYRDTEFEKISGQNASLMFQYLPESESKPTIWVGLEIGTTKSCLHSWEICLVTEPLKRVGEPRVTQLDLRDIHLLNNPPITARYFAFQEKESNYTQVILYWYTRSIFKIGSEYQQKYSKISVIEYTYNPQEYKNIEAELLPIAKAIAEYWQPVINWSWIALAIAENGLILITITGVLLIGTMITFFYLERNKRREARRVYNQISDFEERQILEAIKTFIKESPNESWTTSKLSETSGKDIDTEKLHKKLVEAEKAGIIERKIININDKPYLRWKLNF